MKYKNDKCSNEISKYDKRECQYYKQMDMWNEQYASVVNQMSSSAQNDNDRHNMHITQ